MFLFFSEASIAEIVHWVVILILLHMCYTHEQSNVAATHDTISRFIFAILSSSYAVLTFKANVI